MHRERLLSLLAGYVELHADEPAERAMAERIRTLVRAHTDCFDRRCLPGHITASVWIASSDRKQFLLTHHRKLGRWLQLGGHADGDSDPLAVALREAQEESGMQRFDVLGPMAEGALLPIDVDVHRIPARRREPEHEHHDIRFLLVAEADQPLAISDESLDLRWFDLADLERVCDEESLHRLARKALARLALRP